MLDRFLHNNPWLLDYPVQCLWIFVPPVGLFFLPVAYLDTTEPMRAVSIFGGSLAASAVLAQLVESFSRLRNLRQNLRDGADHGGPYVLFLRSFNQTHGYMTEAIVTSTDASASLHEESLVGDLDEAVRHIGLRLVALGGDLVLPRAQRVIWLQGKDVDWINNATRLAEGARAIILVPDTTAGLVAEMRFLREKGLLGRTIGLMAALPKDRMFVQYPQREARKAAWEQARKQLSREGINLPVYHDGGAVFRLGGDGDLANYFRLDGNGGLVLRGSGQRERLSGLVAEMLTRCDLGGTAFSDVWTVLSVRRTIDEPVPLLRPPGKGSSFLITWGSSLFAGVQFNVMAISMVLFLMIIAGVGLWALLSKPDS